MAAEGLFSAESFGDPHYRSKLLVQHGFIKKDKKDNNYHLDEKEQIWKPREKDAKIDPNDAEEEVTETLKDQYSRTGFPPPNKALKLSWEVYDLSLEEPYFWVLDNLKENFPFIEKVEDSFAAAENSAFFGVTQQRLGAQQDRVSQFLATMGKMIKELFQMVRELRIIDERLQYYRDAAAQLSKPLEERSKASEITLKGFFVDLVQGGGKSPASVYGMARELEFITLPDLFFDAPPLKTKEELDKHVQSLEANFNQNVIRVLHRHLNQYVVWRESTAKEHESRRKFMLKYLDQHYEIIRMYITWVKPYLRHTVKLTLKERSMASADMVSAFEGSMLDIEVLARRQNPDKPGSGNGCVLATFYYRTRPELKVVQEGYQRGPVHMGRFEVHFRIYGWTDEQVAMYKKLKERETMALLENVSESVAKAMQAVGDDLQHYIEEARGEKEKAAEASGSPPKQKTFAEKYFGDFYTSGKKQGKKGGEKKESKDVDESLIIGARVVAWNIFNNFKKAHRMIAW